MTTLVLNQIPRFPAHISASNGLTAIVQNGVDVVIVPSYGDLVPVPAVTKPASTYFMAWDKDIDYYQSISFDQLAENLAGRVLGTTLTAQIDLDMVANQAIYFTSPTVAAAYNLSTFVRGISGSADSSAFRTAIGLGNVNNTSDANKPVSSAQQTALNQKANASDLAALTARTISGAGLATGGGDLTASRTITVTKSTNAQAIAGADDTTAMTPLRTKEAIGANIYTGYPVSVSVPSGTNRQPDPLKAVEVTLIHAPSSSGPVIQIKAGASPLPGSQTVFFDKVAANVAGGKDTATFIVPPGGNYSYTTSPGTTIVYERALG